LNSKAHFSSEIQQQINEHNIRQEKINFINHCLTDTDILFGHGLFLDNYRRVTIGVTQRRNLQYFYDDHIPVYEEFKPFFETEVFRAYNACIKNFTLKSSYTKRELIQFYRTLCKSKNTKYHQVVKANKKEIILFCLHQLDILFDKNELLLSSVEDEAVKLLQKIINLCSQLYTLQSSQDKVQAMLSQRTYKKLRYETERTCYRLLMNKKLAPVLQYKFPDCKDKHILSFDFGFYYNNQLCMIETDGPQHKKAVSFYGGEQQFVYLSKHDQIKDDYCKQHNIPLLRLQYEEFPIWDAQIDRFLSKIAI